MALQKETLGPGAAIISEANGTRSREVITVASGNAPLANTVMGKVTASGKYVPFNQDASDGSETPAGYLYAGVDASDADAAGVVLLRDAELDGERLIWPADIEPAEKDTAIAAFAALGIIVR
jgi:hypothetical protein